MRRVFLICTVFLAGGAAAFGYTNVLENETSQTITNGWDAGGDMFIGDATPSNTLIIVGGGSLTNVDAYVGAQAGASDNTVDISGTGAAWINAGTLQVGAAGNMSNTVSVSGGGVVAASNLVIHAGNDFNLNNNGTLELEGGFNASTNGFSWNSGGTLSVGGELTGLATTNEGIHLSGEKTLVLNGGSLATSTNLIVGYESSDNTFAITNGATASSADGYIGWGSDSANNAVLVSGAGSAWTNSGNLYVGLYGNATNLMTSGANNSLTATNGGWVFVGGEEASLTAKGTGGITVASGAEMKVGEGAGALADGLYIDDAGDFDLFGTLTIAGNFDADQAGFNWEDGSTLAVGGALTLSQALDSTNRTLRIDGGSWDRGGSTLRIDGAGNTLSILNGAGVTNDDAYVVGSNSTVEVSGIGSDWLNNGTLNITNSGNSVAVGDGGKVTADLLNVTEGNTFDLNKDGTLHMTGNFDISAQTSLNWNVGGNLSVSGAFSGLTNLTDSQILTLDGSSATWDLHSTNIYVGDANNFETRLNATNGATVKAANFYVEGANNSVNVAADSWLLVGEGATTNLLPDAGARVASTNGAVLSVDNYASMNIAGTLQIGASNTETGTVSVGNNSTISVDSLVFSGTNSAFNLENGGTLMVASDFNATPSTGFNWYDGGSLSVAGTLTGLGSLGNSNRVLTITGATGAWSTTETNLVAGYNNRVNIEKGGSIASAVAVIGASSNDYNNTISISGSGSVWNVAGNVELGGGGSSNNTLSVKDQGLVDIGGSLLLNFANTLEMASTGSVSIAGNMTVSNAAVAGSGTVAFSGAASQLSIYGSIGQISTNVLFDGGGGADTEVALTDSELVLAGSLTNRFTGFANLNMTNSLFGGNGTADVFDNINLLGGRIAPNGELVVDGAFSATNTLLQLTAGEDSLRVMDGSGLNLSGLSAEIEIAGTNGFDGTILTADGGFSGSFSETNFIEHFLLYDFTLTTNDATTISVESDAAQDGDIGAELAYSGIQGIRAGFNGMQNSAFIRTKQMRRNSVATDYAISSEAYLMSPNAEPSGPQGPGDKNTIFGMHFWAEHFSGQGDYDAMGLSEGFVLNNNGTTFGFDRLFGDSLVAGINYTYARTAASTTGGDRMDTETYWLGLYGEWFGKNDFYLEGLVGYGWSDYTSTRREGDYEGLAEFEGSDIGGHVEVGKYLHYNNWAMVPYAGLHYLSVKSDAYTEIDLGGPPIDVSGQDVDSLESALGVKIRNRFDTEAGRFQIVGYTEWSYDFINDDIGSSLSDGTVSVGTARVAPGESLINAGVGFSWICTDYLEIGIGYDGRFNENYEEHMGSAMLDVRF
ncbi:MAG: autotransporter domain-containing protein [Verrucomicrobia bacterium]|nr:autotransporter domain-containing protein [Verrucomicrobiota bacterium]